MADVNVKKNSGLKGIITCPPDKSISHRAVMFSSISNGKSEIHNLLNSDDVVSTISSFRALGVEINQVDKVTHVNGKGLYGLKAPCGAIDAGNSGTTMRLIMGILASQNFKSVLVGDESLSKRPMDRVIKPLRLMGANIECKDDKYAPVLISPSKLNGIFYKMPIASAQVKSAILLAGLYAEGRTEVIEMFPSRDHTERMLAYFTGDRDVVGGSLTACVVGGKKLSAKNVFVPGDISSAAFFMVAGTIVKNSAIVIKNTGVNPTRTGIIDVLKNMGANLSLGNNSEKYGEPVADISVEYVDYLKPVVIESDVIPRLIDEIPIIMVACCFASGTSKIVGAGELRVKETDRINSMTTNLKKMGADIEIVKDDILIHGKGFLKGAVVDSFADHRTAMACAIAGCAVKTGETVITNAECVSISFPGFFEILKGL